MKATRTTLLIAFTVLSLGLITAKSQAQFGTTLPISESLSTSIAAEAFPVHLKLSKGKLRLSEPSIRFIDAQRVSLDARFQAYDHRPAEGISVSEKGHLRVSGRLGYDRATREILLHDPKIDSMEFDHEKPVTKGIRMDVTATWSGEVTNPIRAEIPPHTYTMPFRNNIEAITYDGKTIGLKVVY